MGAINFGKPILDFGTSAIKLVKEDPAALGKALMWVLPGAAAMSLLNLEPVGDTIGEYMKNKLVPGLDYENRKREAELSAMEELASKQIPILAKEELLSQKKTEDRRGRILQAMEMKDSLVKEIMSDPLIQGTPEENINRLVEDLLKIAPIALSENPAVAKSAVRAAILSGASTIDPETAISLAKLESSILGV